MSQFDESNTSEPGQEPDPLDALDERMEHPPRLWCPKGAPSEMDPADCLADESVRGVVEETDIRSGDYGTYPVLVLVGREKERIQVAGFGTVLNNRLRQVRVGDAVGIRYLGTKPNKTPGMKDPDIYDVVVLRDGRPATTQSPASDADDGGSDPETWGGNEGEAS